MWSDNHWIDDKWWTAIWHECKTLLVAGELLEICSHALSTRLDVGRIHWVQLSRYAASKKDWSSKIAQKSQLHKILYMVVEKKRYLLEFLIGVVGNST